MSACAFDIVSRAVWKLGSRAPRPVPFPGPFARDGWGGPLAFWRHLPRWALVGNCPGVLELEDARGLVGQGLVGSRQRRPGRRGAAPATRPIFEFDKFACAFPKRCLAASAAGSTGTASQADKFVLDFTAFLAKCAPHRRVGFCAHALVVAPRCLRSTSPGVELQCALVSRNFLVFETMDSMRRRSTRVRLASLRGLRASSDMEDALPASLPAKRADNPASCASVEKENGEVTCCRLPRSRCLRSTCPGVELQCTLMSRNCLVFDIMDSTRRQSTRCCGIVCDDSWNTQLLTQFMAKTAQAQFPLKLLCDNHD